jgi:hypothetical protein
MATLCQIRGGRRFQLAPHQADVEGRENKNGLDDAGFQQAASLPVHQAHFVGRQRQAEARARLAMEIADLPPNQGGHLRLPLWNGAAGERVKESETGHSTGLAL